MQHLQNTKKTLSPIVNKHNIEMDVIKPSIAAIFIGNNNVVLVCGKITNLNAVNDNVTANVEIETTNTNIAFLINIAINSELSILWRLSSEILFLIVSIVVCGNFVGNGVGNGVGTGVDDETGSASILDSALWRIIDDLKWSSIVAVNNLLPNINNKMKITIWYAIRNRLNASSAKTNSEWYTAVYAVIKQVGAKIDMKIFMNKKNDLLTIIMVPINT